ncbi:MAG: 5-formyltetrahydrofolate cyclo-ligase [Nanoarchaeota archaeon]
MKHKIRKEILKKRNALTKTQIKLRSKKIEKILFSLKEYKKAKTVMFYVSFGSEVFTHDMIKDALKSKIVVVPKTLDHRMTPSLIKSFKELNCKDKYGILQPFKVKRADKNKIDLVIVPGVAFDLDGYRIGYGKGYYDKFLKGMRAEKIGLAYEFKMIKKVPNEEHDIKVDKVVTEKDVYKI